MSKKVLKLKAVPDFQTAVMARLTRMLPKTGEDGKKPIATFEFSRSTEQVLSAVKYVLRTKVRAFDDIVGGFPFGRICEVYGLESCGKTALMLACAIQAQFKNIYEIERTPEGIVYTKVDPDDCDVAVLYIDNEQSIDDDTKLIVDGMQTDVILARADTVDLLFKMADAVITEAGEREAKFKADGKPRKQFVVIIADTIASTSSRQELEQEWGKDDYPRQAQQISKGFRKLVRDINRHNVSMICTNQVRENVKDSANAKHRPKSPTPQDIEYTTFGGRALRFYASHRIFMYKIQTKYRLTPGAKFADGFLVGFFTVKNRIRKPLREGRMALLFDEFQGGLHDSLSILEGLIFYGMAEITNKTKGTNIVFKFTHNEIPMTTFDTELTTSSLTELDEKPKQAPKARGRKDPSILSRAKWIPFYEAHKADLDALWAAGVKRAFECEAMSGMVIHDQEGEEGDETLNEEPAVEEES